MFYLILKKKTKGQKLYEISMSEKFDPYKQTKPTRIEPYWEVIVPINSIWINRRE